MARGLARLLSPFFFFLKQTREGEGKEREGRGGIWARGQFSRTLKNMHGPRKLEVARSKDMNLNSFEFNQMV